MHTFYMLFILIISQATLPLALPRGDRDHQPFSSTSCYRNLCSTYDVPKSSQILSSQPHFRSSLKCTSSSLSHIQPSISPSPEIVTAGSSEISALRDGTDDKPTRSVVRHRVNTITLTSLNSTQTATTTSAAQSTPITTGSIITTIQTAGNPPLQPFPTGLPNVTQPTLQPSSVILSSNSFAATPSVPSILETLTIPIFTFETVITATTVAVVPSPTTVAITQISVVGTTVTSSKSTYTTATIQSTTFETTASVLVPTTVTSSSTVITTSSTVVSSGALSTIIPTPTSICIFDIGCSGQDLFEAIDVNSPPANIPQVGNHPVPRLGIEGMTGPIETNKFYANFFLGDQGFPTFTMPYTIAWSQGGGNAQSWGMAMWHTSDSQRVYGPNNTVIPGDPASFYINPLGIQYIIFSAAELGSSTTMTTNTLSVLSGNVVLSPTSGSASSISFPLVQGMSFVTGVYTALQPEIQSSVFFSEVISEPNPKAGVYKYRVYLDDQSEWLIYATSSSGVDPSLKLISSSLLQGIPDWSGSIQVAKLPQNGTEALYDAACGAYPISGNITGYASGSTAQYALSWAKGGQYASNTTLLMYALPHHVQSFNNATSGKITSLQLSTTTKGLATAVNADYWVLTESDLPVSMGFAPWRPDSANVTALSSTAVAAIQQVSATEASQNMTAQCDLNSMYYSGKCLSKFAQLVYVMNDLSDQQSLAASALAELKSTFEIFVNNQQPYPLYYDIDWKGVVSSASYITGNPGIDFGNTYYNDHHFHYGYFLHAASVIGYLDPSWLETNRDWVNSLARDVSNPTSLDTYFPVFRMLDFYNGHSWAAGLFESGDGKNEESSSEDAMFAYGLKMWGRTIGDASMEARGNLMLSVLSRSLQNYFLLESDNINQPAEFIDNKVSGILFENKVDHTTYFGTNLEYIEGIHMLPLLPFSTLTRTQTFVQQEWDVYFGDGSADPAENVAGGWRGILFANLAIINPQAAFNFFSQANFNPEYLDGGASLTWYLAWAAGLGGA